jgi:pilus assembly protein CpaF
VSTNLPFTSQAILNGLPIEQVRQVRARVYSQISPAEILSRLKINPGQVRRDLRAVILQVVDEDRIVLGRGQKELMVQRILDDVLGFGPIEPLLNDPSISEIMINGPHLIFIERNGCLSQSQVVFENNQHLMNVIDRMVAPIGRRVDESSPMVDGRLPDGSRINVIIPPLALSGPTVTIRKFGLKVFTFDGLIENGTVSSEMAEFLRKAVKGRLNILVTGGTGSGKTTLLNALSGLIPPNERIVTIEDAAELKFSQPHVVRLESRPANIEGRGRVAIRDLVINALRMRPDRIVVGEVRGGETLDMLQAMNTGHNGSLTTAHANSPTEALSRLETMALMAGLELPIVVIRAQIAGAFDLIVHMERRADGRRLLSAAMELAGLDDDRIVLRPIGVGVE